MIENLKNMEPLSEQEEYRIDRRLRTLVICLAACVLAYVIWCGVTHRGFTMGYYALVILFLICNWLLLDVFAVFWKRSFAGRSDEQISAYLKAAGLGLVANAGLGFFLLTMNDRSLFGALLYFVGITGARKQREIYEGRNTDQEDEDKGDAAPGTEDMQDALPDASDRAQRETDMTEAPEEAETPEDLEAPEEAETPEDAEASEETDGSV